MLFMRCARICEQAESFTLHIINWFFFSITEVENVYCEVRTDSLYKVDYV